MKNEKRPWQFSLRALLLATAALALMLGIGSTMYRRAQEALVLAAIELDEHAHGAIRRRNGRVVRLNNMFVKFCRFDDADMVQIAKLRSLEALVISGPVTDTGLMHLEDLPRLQQVMLFRTNVTLEGADRLRQALPQCEVVLHH